MTEEQADTKIKARFNSPFARAIDRPDKTYDRYFVGLPPYYGVGTTWEEAFANLRHWDLHRVSRWHRARHAFNAPMFRARRATLKERF